eukprot:235881-Prymnesium_polylepis.1
MSNGISAHAFSAAAPWSNVYWPPKTSHFPSTTALIGTAISRARETLSGYGAIGSQSGAGLSKSSRYGTSAPALDAAGPFALPSPNTSQRSSIACAEPVMRLALAGSDGRLVSHSHRPPAAPVDLRRRSTLGPMLPPSPPLMMTSDDFRQAPWVRPGSKGGSGSGSHDRRATSYEKE